MLSTSAREVMFLASVNWFVGITQKALEGIVLGTRNNCVEFRVDREFILTFFNIGKTPWNYLLWETCFNEWCTAVGKPTVGNPSSVTTGSIMHVSLGEYLSSLQCDFLAWLIGTP